MIGLRAGAALAAALACFALDAAAQGVTSSDPRKTPKAEETKDQTNVPAPQKKATPAPKKTDAAAKTEAPAKKAAAPKKAPPKKAPPKKKVDEKAQVTPQGGTVQKYEAGKAPDLRDAKGNTIQTSPDAYDISSAKTPPKKK